MDENDGRVMVRQLPATSFRLPLYQLDWLREKAARENKAVTAVLREMIEKARQEERKVA